MIETSVSPPVILIDKELDVLESVIFSLTSDEVRRFKILSNRFKADDEKKLILLFDGIRSEKFLGNETLLLEELYGENNAQTRNRYYRLRNKLLENIEKSLVFYHFKYKDSIHAYYDIQLSIMFRERGHYRLSLYFLKKGEKKAKELDKFIIMEQIYEEYTQLALLDIEIDIESILEERQLNLDKIKIHRRNSQAIAIITQQLKKSNFSRGKASVLELLTKTKKRIERSADIFNSPEGKIQLFRTVSALLLQKEAFPQLVEYLRQTIHEFETEGLFNNDNHATRLLMRIWLANALYKVFKFKECLDELDVMEQEMKMFGRQNYFAYLFNFYSTKINVLKCLGKIDEAAALTQEALGKKEVTGQSINEVYLLRSLADQHFSNKQFTEALKVLSDIKTKDGFLHLDLAVQMYVDIFALILHFEAGNFTEIEQEMKALRKAYKSVLKEESQEKTERFLELLLRMSTAELEGKRVSIRSAYRQLEPLFEGNAGHGDNEIVMYGLYILSKVEKRGYYEIFVERMAMASSLG